jgi:phosphoglycolate phosphatase-like HAD superfamily hydrolase
MNIVFDIDGVLADNRHRFKLIESAPKDWDAYYEMMSLDPLHEEMAAVFFDLSRANSVFLCTGRPQKYRAATKAWFEKNDMWEGVYRLFMRPDGDMRPNPDLKEDMAKLLHRDYHGVDMVFEDDTRSVERWRKYAPLVLEVKHGI